eukprot:1232402-Amphidinium_carterae.1
MPQSCSPRASQPSSHRTQNEEYEYSKGCLATRELRAHSDASIASFAQRALRYGNHIPMFTATL